MKRTSLFLVIFLLLGVPCLWAQDLPYVVTATETIQFQNRGFQFKLTLLNPSKLSQKVDLEYQAASPGIQYAKNKESLSLRAGEASRSLDVLGLIGDIYIDHRIALKVKVTVNSVSREYVLRARLFGEPRGTKIGDLDGRELQWIKLIRGDQGTYLVSVDRNRAMTLYLLKSSLQKIGAFSLESGEDIAGAIFQALDSDDDGRDDFLLITGMGGKTKRLTYFGPDFKVTLRGDLTEDYALPGETSLRYIRTVFEGKKLKAPAFIAKGSVTKSDVEPGDFSFVDPDRHIYWIGAKRTGSKVSFVTRTLSHERFREKVLSQLTVGINSFLDFMVIPKRKDVLQILGGVKDHDGITLSGVSVEIASTEDAPKVKSIGFERPLDKQGILLPIESEKGITTGGDILFVSSPLPSKMSLFGINGTTTTFQRMTPLGEVVLSSPDVFVDIPLVYKRGDESTVWLRSTYWLLLSKGTSTFDSYPLPVTSKLDRVAPTAMVVSSGKDFSVLKASRGMIKTALDSSFLSEACFYLGVSDQDLFYVCSKGSSSQLFMLSNVLTPP